MGKKYSLLIVDDERDIVDLLYDYFRKDYTVYKAYNAEEAVNIFNENEIHLVMTDQRMPGMQGTELLSLFREKKPEVVRFLMTGYTELEVAIEAINNGSVSRYLQKPLNFDELAGIIKEGLQAYEEFHNKKYSLLIIDDERGIVDQLFDYFRKDFTVHKAYDAEEAVNIFNENEIHLVMTDQRMPGMQGTELLATFKEKKPEVTRILMTGYTDIEIAIEAINNGSIHRYLQKPLNFDELAGIIEEGLQAFEQWGSRAKKLMIANEKGAALKKVSENREEMITHKPGILRLILEQCLLHEEVEVQINEHKQAYHTRVLDRFPEPGKDMGDSWSSQYTPFTYLKKGQCLLLDPIVSDEAKAQINEGDRLLLRFFTGHHAYETFVPFERSVEVHGERMAIQVGFPTQLRVVHVRKHIRVKALRNSNIELKLTAENLGDFKTRIIELSASGLSCCVPDLFVEKLPVRSKVSLRISVMGEDNLVIDACIQHFGTMPESEYSEEKSECDEKFGSFKAICGMDFIITDSFHELRLNDLVFFVQREYLIKEKEGLIKFNLELEKQVKDKTGQLREKDVQLLEMDRIAGIATLAAGIAHEINNPLGFVKSSINFVEKNVGKMAELLKYWDDKPIPEQILKDYKDYRSQINFNQTVNSLEDRFERIKNGIERIMQIVKNLKSFSRVDRVGIDKVRINENIEETIRVLSSKGEENVEFVKELQEIPPLECSANDINQCLFHLLQNAVDAVEGNGIIRVSSAYNEKEEQVIVSIVDNGKGMSPEILRQVFNPFFTTKPVGSGTGVGLSIVERMIKHNGGKIEFSSKENFGTTAIMTLPTKSAAQNL